MKSGTEKRGISLLNFDGTLRKQPLLRTYPGEWIDFSDLRGCHGYCSIDALRRIRQRLHARKHKRITLIGNGNYHYVTYLLLTEIRQPFSLILFDHHTDLAAGDPISPDPALHEPGPDDFAPDGVPPEDPSREGEIPVLSCGSWVSAALNTLPLLNRVVIIGAHSSQRGCGRGSGAPGNVAGNVAGKVVVLSEQEVSRSTAKELAGSVLSALPGVPVYVSVDKDVLDREHAVTNWDQGSMTLRQLLEVLRELKRARTISGADICGELPLSPVDALSGDRVRNVKKNEIANKAIVDVLLTG
jgi:hypothetical protein